jgi:hypothetical protein
VAGDISDARYCGVRGQAEWGFLYRRRQRNIKRSLQQEEIFQALVDYDADLKIVGAQGRTLLMMACKEGTCVIAANILYRIGERRWSEAIQATDFEFRGEDSAPSCGYISTLKVLLYRQRILVPENNFWRVQAILGEERSKKWMPRATVSQLSGQWKNKRSAMRRAPSGCHHSQGKKHSSSFFELQLKRMLVL